MSTFVKSKVTKDVVLTGIAGKLNMPKHGVLVDKVNVPFKSGTKAATPPTSL